MSKKDRQPKRGDDSGSGVETLERVSTKLPRKFKVLMHNDDYTTQEFVVHVLEQFFRKGAPEATRLMLQVHTKGQAVVGVFTRDIAESKVDQVTGYARENGMPLMLTAEPE